MKFLEKLKIFLSRFYHSQKVRKAFKKLLFWSFLTGSFFAFILFSIFLVFYIKWQGDKEEVLKQAEIYYNQILKETEVIEGYNTIGGKAYTLKNVEEPIKVLDFRGELIGEFSNEKRSFISSKNISPYFFYALFSTEDAEFYNHTGINFKAIIRAMVKNVAAMKVVQGGSTLTQQLSKLLFTERERSIKRKIYEFFCARELEKIYTKDDILLMYANLIFFGHGAYGVEYASQLFFNKSAKDLDISEGSFLVALISNPGAYSPYNNIKRAMIKHHAVLYRMADTGYITTETAEELYKKFWEKNKFLKKDLSKVKQIIRTNDSAYIMEEVRRFIVNEFGEEFFVKNKGSVIYTTIDKRLQSYGEELLAKNLKYYRTIASGKASNKKLQGAIVFSVPQTGEIRVLVGGDGFSSENQLNRAVQAKRQIGSTIKPFLYLSGIEAKVITAYTVFEDKPITIEMENAPEDQKYWNVKNYEDTYKGYLTATEALFRSANVVAAQIAELIGVDRLRKILGETLRLPSKETDKRFPSYQYSMSLGAVEMTPLEVNTLYMMLANRGMAVEPYLISKVMDNKSRSLYEQQMVEKRQVINRESVYILIHMMKKVLQPGGTAGYLKSSYGLNFDLAGKTGTTQDNRDAWFNAFNVNLAGTVWIGHDENISMGKSFTGGGVASPLVAAILKKASEYYEWGNFTYDESYHLVNQPVCLLSGKVPEPGKCKYIVDDALFLEGTEPGQYCDLTPEEETKRAIMKGIETGEAQSDTTSTEEDADAVKPIENTETEKKSENAGQM